LSKSNESWRNTHRGLVLERCVRAVNQREILTEDLYYRTLSESYETERNTHRGLVLGRWVRAMNQREILTEDLYLDVCESYESERNTHRGLVLGRVWWLGIRLHCLLCTRTSPLDA
jgi:hypothetical protein